MGQVGVSEVLGVGVGLLFGAGKAQAVGMDGRAEPSPVQTSDNFVSWHT